jgi:hypothetical protein
MGLPIPPVSVPRAPGLLSRSKTHAAVKEYGDVWECGNKDLPLPGLLENVDKSLAQQLRSATGSGLQFHNRAMS